ncbi:sulfite exporter TauE/SafE family protein [Aquisalinus flavus]|nr:sulfite exporter TauE/SafE family protein [Aquisalinus flavus]UNE49195.1 sulfite exporter TauE/SafE family protein [Aquisalinus flavus]
MLLLGLAGVGLFAGFLAGLFGIGGGIVIVPALYAVFGLVGVPEEERIKAAVATSLATIIVTSLRSVTAHMKHGAVDMDLLKRWAPWIGLGAIVGAVAARFIPAEALTLIFALGALGVAIRRGLFRTREVPRASALAPVPGGPVAAALGGGIGFLSSLMGIGGGVLGVIVLTAYGRTIHQAIATSAGFGLAIAVPGTLGFIGAGWGITGLSPLSIGYVSLPAFALIAVMTFLTAPLGASLAHRLDKGLLNRVFAIYLGVTALLLLRDTIS